MKATILVSMSLALVFSAEVQAEPPCNVYDKSGTPLNLRATPNGKVIATLKDDTEISPTNSLVKYDKQGRGWTRIKVNNPKRDAQGHRYGWVAQKMIACG